MHLKIVTLKSFGDFVIASNAIKNLQIPQEMVSPEIIAGEHVRSLALALGLSSGVLYVGGTRLTDVPSAFDIKKRGLLSGLISLCKLRASLKGLGNMQAIFDSLGWRELFLAHGQINYALPLNCPNIYLAYDQFFRSHGYSTLINHAETRKIFNKAVIIPGSRMPSKVIPASVISVYLAELRRRKITATIFLLDGESIDLPSEVRVIKIPRNFDSLFMAIRSADLVISADSLSGHVSNFYNIPVFIGTPKPNPYWLPRSAYLSNGWAIFGKELNFADWLDSTNFN